MEMRPNVQITSMIKAMTDVIIPALDADHKLAMEQAQLMVGMLHLMARQLPLQFRADYTELKQLVVYADTLKAIPTSDTTVTHAFRQLDEQSIVAIDRLDRAKVDPAELVTSIHQMRETIGRIVTLIAATTDLDLQIQVEKVIIDLSKEQLLRDRSLMITQGWEPAPQAVPDIENEPAEFV